jgi:hypothetical protein
MQNKSDLRARNLRLAIEMLRFNKDGGFGIDPDHLTEIGRLTMYFASLEAQVALCCETLLFRPELAGFNQTKPVAEKHFKEKLDLYKILAVAIGVLHSVKTSTVEETITQARRLGEARNCITHGYFVTNDNGERVFRGRENEIPANLDGLRSLNSRVLGVFALVGQAFTEFFKQVVNISSKDSHLEAAIIKAFESGVRAAVSWKKADESRARVEFDKKAIVAAEVKLNASRAQLQASRARLRAVIKKLPPEIGEPLRKLFAERNALLRRRASLARRMERTGLSNPQLEVADKRLK